MPAFVIVDLSGTEFYVGPATPPWQAVNRNPITFFNIIKDSLSLCDRENQNLFNIA